MGHSAAAVDGAAKAAQAAAISPIRLMIVDDSAVARAVLSRMISGYKDLEVVALAGNAGEALDALRAVKVDIVLLDVEMPGTSGLEALADILRLGEGARVLIVSSLCEDGAEATVKALALGAADTLPKPGAGNFGGRFSDTLADRLRRIGRVERPQVSGAGPRKRGPSIHLRAMPDYKLGCIALGASTGGLYALNDFLRTLPPQIGVPILITQHLPAVFMSVFARQIETASGRVTAVAEDGLELRSGEIIVAPGDAHIGLRRHGSAVRIALCRKAVPNGCMPSVDPMLEAVAAVYGKSAVGIIFSGMGRDGLIGSGRLVDGGGAILVQDESSSAVWGMPRAVAEAGLACAILPPVELAKRIQARAAGALWK